MYPHSRAAAGGRGCSRRLMRVACVLCGACSGHLSVVSRAALRPTRILLFRYYGIDTRAAACHPVKGNGRRQRSAPRPFGQFWSSCTAVMHGPRVRSGLRVGAGGVVEECWRRCDGRRGAHWRRRRGRTSGDATRAATRLHRCSCEARGWGISRGGGEENGEARGGKGM